MTLRSDGLWWIYFLVHGQGGGDDRPGGEWYCPASEDEVGALVTFETKHRGDWSDDSRLMREQRVDIQIISCSLDQLLSYVVIRMFEAVVESIFSSPALYFSITFASFLLWPLLRILRTYFLLRRVPGPFWTHFTGLWVALRLRKGISLIEICTELDQKYGPVVRLGPKNVLFSDPSVIPIIYATTRAWRKVWLPLT
jgi:hypothetical protein